MKIKEGFMLREIADSWIAVPIGQRVVEFNGLMSLSESGALLWKELEKGAGVGTLVKVLLAEYDVDEATATSDVGEFISLLEKRGLLE